MSLSPMAQNVVSRSAQAAKYLVEQLKPLLDELDVLYNSAGGLKSTISQGDLDSIASFSGLTKQQLDDALYALTSTLKSDLSAAYTQLAQLASRT
jgi:hypothetical protein